MWFLKDAYPLMSENQNKPLEPDQKQRFLSLFERLLPLVDSLADKLRTVIFLGLLTAVWLVVWLYFLKHFSVGITLAAAVAVLLPALILARFWWALEELKNLPEIAGQMLGDAKSEFIESAQTIRAGKFSKFGFFSAGKSLWSVGAMASEARELAGSYLSITTLVNPFMLILGIISCIAVFAMFFCGVVLAFFI